jgi:hypothetical protein
MDGVSTPYAMIVNLAQLVRDHVAHGCDGTCSVSLFMARKTAQYLKVFARESEHDELQTIIDGMPIA